MTVFLCLNELFEIKWNHLTVSKKIAFAFLKMLSTKCVLEIIYLIYVWKGFGIKWPTMVDMPWN